MTLYSIAEEVRLMRLKNIFIFILAALSLLAWLSTQATNELPSLQFIGASSTEEQAYDAIRKLQPKLSAKTARQLAKSFIKVSITPECGIPWQILVSIAFNESSLGLKLHNNKSKDYGLMQINHRTIQRMTLDKDRLLSDPTYSISAGCQVLAANKQAYAKKHSFWLGIYRSGTALYKVSIKENAKRYHKIIMRTAAKIGYKETPVYAKD